MWFNRTKGMEEGENNHECKAVEKPSPSSASIDAPDGISAQAGQLTG
jgi:hypothetical protein